MEIPEHRRWMYNRIDPQTRNVRSDFIWGVESFISAAYQLDDFKDDEKIRCPCCICQCVRRKPPDVAKEKDRDVSVAEVFEMINFDQENEKWYSSRSEAVYGQFKKRKEEALLQGREVDDSTLFYEATGGKNRQGRAYGFGST